MALLSVLNYHTDKLCTFLWVWHQSTLISAHHTNFIQHTFFFWQSYLVSSQKRAYVGSLSALIWKKLTAECMWRPMATVFYREQRAQFGIVGSKTALLTWATRTGSLRWGPSLASPFERERYPIVKMLAEQLGDTQPVISMCPSAIGKVQMIGKWMPHELNDKQVERRQTTCEILPARQKKSRSCIKLCLTMKSGYILRILNARNRALIPVNHQNLLQDQIISDGRRCCAFGGISRVSSTMSCWNLIRVSMPPATTNNWSNCTVLCVKKD